MKPTKTKLNIKALSVNQCWQGRRFKTPQYKAYETEILYSLPTDIKIPKKARIELKIGVSSKNADIDNPVKPLLDCLQKKYSFNDKQIYKLIIEKIDVPKGEEYIEFDIKEYTEKLNELQHLSD